MPWVHDEKTPQIIDAWVRMNFTVPKPWALRIHHHMDDLPPLLPGKDEAQCLMGCVGTGPSRAVSPRSCRCVRDDQAMAQ